MGFLLIPVLTGLIKIREAKGAFIWQIGTHQEKITRFHGECAATPYLRISNAAEMMLDVTSQRLLPECVDEPAKRWL